MKLFENGPDNAAAELDIKKLERTNDRILYQRSTYLSYTEGQKRALKAIAMFLQSALHFQFTLAGYAGTGKTTIVENIVNFALSKGKTVYVVAPTNQAVKVLKEKMPEEIRANFRTLHSLLYGHPDEKGAWIPRVSFSSDDVVICDEGSLVNEDLHSDLKTQVCGSQAKLLYIGDSYQLEPVGKDPHILEQPDEALDEVRRQAAESQILMFATALRKERRVFIPQESCGDVTIMRTFPADTAFLEAIKNEEDAVCIVGSNRTRKALNIRARRAKFGEVEPPQKGDVLLSISNGQKCVNGDRLLLEELEVLEEINLPLQSGIASALVGGAGEWMEKAYLLKDKEKDHKILLLPEVEKSSVYHAQVADLSLFPSDWVTLNTKTKKNELDKEVSICTYGYAVTAHKSQGSQWAKVFVKQDCFKDNARWLYTAVTRAAKELILSDTGVAKLSWSEIEMAIH